MDKDLRKILERRGLAPTASDDEAKAFFDSLSLEERGKIGTEMALRGWEKTERPEQPLTTRASALEAIQSRQITTRAFTLRAESVDEDTRSVEAVIATDSPVTVYDWRSGDLIDEVLLMKGAGVPDQVPMLANHSRWSLDDIYGSARGIKTKVHEAVGRLYFATDADSERAWQKVRDGHLRDVSAGYHTTKYTDIRPGQSAVVEGKTYKASARTLRVATRWALREVSLVPIGADTRAKIRGDLYHKEKAMNTQLREYLESLGLRSEADEPEAAAFLEGLEGEQKQRADEITSGAAQRTKPPADSPRPLENRTEPPIDAEAIARQAIADERARVRGLTELAGDDVPQEVLRAAIDDGSSVEEASGAFLRAIRERGPEGEPLHGPAIHSRTHAGHVNARSLATALLIQNGLDPTQHREYSTARAAAGPRFSEEDADRGDLIRSLSAPDLFRECVQCDTGRRYRTVEEALARVHDDQQMGRAATSGGTLSYVFGTNVYAKVIEGWNRVGDSTIGWCDEEDVPNFLTQEEIAIDYNGQPDQHSSGMTANDASISDSHETYRAYRFSKKASIDEIDIINDRLGGAMKIFSMMGMAFRRMRPNLVYSTLLSNPTLVKDSLAVFHATHNNLGSAALAADALAAALSAIASQRDANNEVLDIHGRYLIVPTALGWTGAVTLTSGALAKTHATTADPNYMPVNPVGPIIIKQVNGDTLSLVVDDRIGATGCWNPMTKAMQTGSATNWFVTAGMQNGVRVLYRRGTNRLPAVRNYTLEQGQWGIGMDTNYDIGCKIMAYQELYKSTGTG